MANTPAPAPAAQADVEKSEELEQYFWNDSEALADLRTKPRTKAARMLGRLKRKA